MSKTSSPPAEMAHDGPRGGGPSKVLSILDLLIKLAAVGALFGILAMLIQMHEGLNKVLEGDKSLRVGVFAAGSTRFPISAELSNSIGGNGFRVDTGREGTSSLNPIYVRSAN